MCLETSTVDRIFLEGIYDQLLTGDISDIEQTNIRAINVIATRLYNEKDLNKEDITSLKILIMICNLLYNRTDMEVLPIEDGFYDLLLEKYKIYDSNFQVGAAVVEVQSTIRKDPNYKPVTCPIRIFKDEKERDPISQSIHDEIMLKEVDPLNSADLYRSPIYLWNEYIEKRTHNTQHEHPDLVGTLDKCKFVFVQDTIDAGCIDDPNVKILERDFFGKHIKDGIISPDQELTIVLELKYDGVSVEADCDNEVISARTRGDTGIGEASDITPILRGYPFKHAKVMIGNDPIGVKFEAIMTKSALSEYCRQRMYNYVNCRYAMIGLFTSSDAYKFRDLITLVPLEVDRSDLPSIDNRITEIEFLNEVFRSNGEPLRYCTATGTVAEILFYTKKFLEEASEARDYLNFMYDGIVVSYLDENIRHKLGRQNHINKYSMAVKFNPMSKITTFRGYTYEVGQNGNITPIIHYDPVEFFGTIHDKSTGSSLARFKSLGLRYADHIEVTYRNDVMPYVTKPDTMYNKENTNPLIEPPTKCPVCGSDLVVSESGKTLRCPNYDCYGRKVAKTVNMLAKLNLKGFGEQMVKIINRFTLKELVDLDHEYLDPLIGQGNAANFIELMNRLKTEPIYDYQIVGALGFTGIASKTWKLIFSKYDIIDILGAFTYGDDTYINLIATNLCNMNGIGKATVDTIINEMPMFIDDLYYIGSMPNVKRSKDLGEQKQVRFTGCRDLQLEQLLSKEGIDADSSSGVTKKTDILLVPYEGYTSTKTRKVGPNCKIVPIDEFRNNVDFYIS